MRSLLSRWSWVSCLTAFGALGCAEGTLETPFPNEPGADNENPRVDAGPTVVERPDHIDFAVDEQGEFEDDAVGFAGTWQGNAGPSSNVSLRFEDGAVCLSGETAQVQNEDYTTYFGAEATFSLCETNDELAPVEDCIGKTAKDFVGVRFTLENAGTAELPWLVVVRFNETERETPAALVVDEGETTAFFARQTNPFDTSAPAPEPTQLESLSIRAVGNTDGPQSFDFCLSGFTALFGDEWEAALIPDWLQEPGPGLQTQYGGVNLVGAEFGQDNLPGTYGSDYIYPDEYEVALYAEREMNVIRLPFRWERLQRGLYADLDETELLLLRDSVATILAAGQVVILDPHNFARYTEDGEEQLLGEDIEPDTLSDFWGKVANEFKDESDVWFGLINEPHDMPTENWLEAANLSIAAIRDVGATNRVLVPGNQWTGAHSWFATYYGTPNAEVMGNVEDPANNFAFEFHQYFDRDYSGTANTCVSETIGVETVSPVTDWLHENHFQGFLGEFGGSDDPICLGAMEQLLVHVGDNSDVWLGWTAWAASAWGIQHNVRPLNNRDDTLQMQVLLRHLGAR